VAANLVRKAYANREKVRKELADVPVVGGASARIAVA
jgi:hypothetical protein